MGPYTLTLDKITAQADVLQKSLLSTGVEIADLEAQQIVCEMHGYANWAAAVEALSSVRVLHVVHCFLEKGRDPQNDQRGTFDFYVMAKDADQAMAMCERQIAEHANQVSTREAFPESAEITVESVFEINSIPADGSILNYRGGRWRMRTIRELLPCEDPDPAIRLVWSQDRLVGIRTILTTVPRRRGRNGHNGSKA